jgi:hypothetical protein
LNAPVTDCAATRHCHIILSHVQPATFEFPGAAAAPTKLPHEFATWRINSDLSVTSGKHDDLASTRYATTPDVLKQVSLVAFDLTNANFSYELLSR